VDAGRAPRPGQGQGARQGRRRGDDPTVLGFMLASTGNRVVFELVNLAEPPTLVFRSAGPDSIGVINRALVDSGFKSPTPAGGGLTAPARRVGEPAVLTEEFVGEVPHDGNWSSRLATLLAD
jgi:hypothetical protein